MAKQLICVGVIKAEHVEYGVDTRTVAEKKMDLKLLDGVNKIDYRRAQK